MIGRRDFANAVTLGLLGAPIIAAAQQSQRLPLVGMLHDNLSDRGPWVRRVVRGLGELGYVEGKNVAFEFRSPSGKSAAAELATLKVDVIFAVGPAAITAARDATRVIPIVALDYETDPVQVGWALSLARPGGNLTGLFLDNAELVGKWFDLLRTAAPGIRRIGLLWNSKTGTAQLDAAKAAAQHFGIELHVMAVRGYDDIEAALGAGTSAGIAAIVILGAPEFSQRSTAKLIADFAANHRLRSISPFRQYSDAGGLMSYGLDQDHFDPRAGVMIGKILKGARPGDLPIERPTKFDLVINLKTARILGLELPATFLGLADEVIE